MRGFSFSGEYGTREPALEGELAGRLWLGGIGGDLGRLSNGDGGRRR